MRWQFGNVAARRKHSYLAWAGFPSSTANLLVTTMLAGSPMSLSTTQWKVDSCGQQWLDCSTMKSVSKLQHNHPWNAKEAMVEQKKDKSQLQSTKQPVLITFVMCWVSVMFCHAICTQPSFGNQKPWVAVNGTHSYCRWNEESIIINVMHCTVL